MPILAELSGTLDVTADDSPYVLGDLEITDASPFVMTLDVDDRAAVAFASRSSRIGLRIVVNGVALPSKEMARVVSISESRSTFGDELTIKLAGERFSPFARALLRSRAHVEVYAKIGRPGAEHDAKIFDGYVVDSQYDAQPPSATVTCLDAAALYAQKRAREYTLAPNSGKTRLQVGLELCAIGGIPVGAVDLPNGTGGTINKPIAPGDQPILDYLRDFWGVLGVWVGFEDGRLVARRYRDDEPIVAELHAGNILAAGLSAHAPATLDPNVIGVVAVSFDRQEIGGRRTTETRVTTVGPYAPASASGTHPEMIRTISDVVTRTTYLGTLDVRTEEMESEWFAPRAAPKKIQSHIDPPGYEIVDATGVYSYPDGTTRSIPVERFQEVRRRIAEKDVDGDYNVIRVTERKYFYHFLRRAIWQVQSGEDVLQGPGAISLNDEGEGLAYSTEVSGLILTGGGYANTPDEITVTEYALASDGTISTETETVRYHTIGDPRLRADDAYGYGVDEIAYTAHPTEESTNPGVPWRGVRITTRRYRVINEDVYEAIETVRVGNAPPTTKTSRMAGAPPRPERAEPETTAQEIRREDVDAERVAYAGGEEIDRIEHNEFIETTGDADIYVAHLAREAAAIRLPCTIPFETLIHTGRALRVNLPHIGIANLKFYVDEVERDAARGTESIVALYYPPELS